MLTLMAPITAAQRCVPCTRSDKLYGWCFQVFSLSFTSSVNKLPVRFAGMLAYTQPFKTQSLKNKYIMPMAMKQVGVLAV